MAELQDCWLSDTQLYQISKQLVAQVFLTIPVKLKNLLIRENEDRKLFKKSQQNFNAFNNFCFQLNAEVREKVDINSNTLQQFLHVSTQVYYVIEPSLYVITDICNYKTLALSSVQFLSIYQAYNVFSFDKI